MEGVYFKLESEDGNTILLSRKVFVFWEKTSTSLIIYPRSYGLSEQIRELLYCLSATFIMSSNNIDIEVYSKDESWYRVLGVLSFMKYNDEPITLVRIS